jgi:ligand-binding sensor domain-containing protein
MNKISFLLIASLIVFTGCSDDNDEPAEIPDGLPGNVVNAIYITDDGLRYFATDKGLASFDGLEWTVHHDNPNVTAGTINDLDFELTSYGPEFWLATNKGVNVVVLPVDATSGATTYTRDNTGELFPGQPGLAGDSVFVARVDDNNIRWFGTHRGLSAFRGNQWPEIDLGRHYHQDFFVTNRITSIDHANDTIYIGTRGGGVARLVAGAADAITGASPYEIPWSMIPSDNILAVFTYGSTQWYGSDAGIAKHEGTEAKDNWTLYFEGDGLVNNYVQSINKDTDGTMWFGTRVGVSSFDGENWTSYTQGDGLADNNVLCIAVDADGSLWFGTGNGVSRFDGSEWVTYRASGK